MTEERVEVPLFVIGAEDVPIMFSNLMVVQHEQREFIINFGQYAPPLTLGPPERRLEQVKAMPYAPVKIVARIGLTPERMAELIDALQRNYNKWKEKQEEKEP